VDLFRIEQQDRLAKRLDDCFCLHANNGLQARLSVAHSGRYAWLVRARGTAVDGVYPRLEFAVDQQVVGYVDVAGESWADHRVPVDLAAGKHTFTVRFVNDACRPPQDRNVWIGRWLFAELHEPQPSAPPSHRP